MVQRSDLSLKKKFQALFCRGSFCPDCLFSFFFVVVVLFPSTKSFCGKMSSERVIRVGGVPEHFNYPWHLAKERGLFRSGTDELSVEWRDCKGGTGLFLFCSCFCAVVSSHFVENSYFLKVR